MGRVTTSRKDTPTTGTATPMFSKNSSVQPGTPDTDPESEFEVTATRTRAKAPSKKRAVQSDDLDSEEEEELDRPPAKKRMVTKSRAFVEIPQRSHAKKLKIHSSHPAVKARQKTQSPSQADAPPAKGKGKASAAPVPKSVKGKGKARAVSPEDDEVEVESDHSLQFDEVAALEESSGSGSEFQASDNDEEDDEIMLQAALKESLAPQKAGSSSRGTRSDPAAALRAAAAERRLAGGQSNVVDDSEAFLDLSDLSSDLSEAEDSDGEPLSKTKGKGKAKAKTTVRTQLVVTGIAQTKKERREQRKAAMATKRSNREEEAILAQELGRKLTYAERSTVALQKNHPELKDVWGDLESKVEIIVPEKAEQPSNLKVTLLPFQRESLFWMRKQEEGIWKGGMLADEMGMGKTIQILALLVGSKVKPNLVVAPTVAVMQWRNEINAHTDGMKVLVWHGATRMTDITELKRYDVVLTTYAIVESCFRKQHTGFQRKGVMIKQKSPLHQIKWNRIILDEAHNIKERSTNTAKAAFELDGNYRWCLSGTPLQNRVGELYSLVRFLGGDPFSYYFCKDCDCKSLHWKFSNKRACDDCNHSPMRHTCFWNNEILTPIQKNGMAGPGANAFKKLKILLDRMMLRRTKLERADDLGLPPRTVIVRRDYFSEEERELYLSLFSDAKRQFSTYLDQGTVLNNYSNIFSLLTRMRQMACHPDLVLKSKTNASKFGDDFGEGTVCRICNDIAEDAIKSKCRHIFDRECIAQYLQSSPQESPECPVCHLPITIDLDAPALEAEEAVRNARQGILGRLNVDTWRSSSKIEALVEELSNLRLQDATTKSLVFSQFVNFLDLIAFRLQKAGFTICRLEGTMSPQARNATIEHFMNNVGVTVFLVSLKAGGVALNLVEASRVYLMDSWWNPAVEYQAMDRIHRLGQHRPVQAFKLVIEDSIESRIVQLQEKKTAMVDAALGNSDEAMGRLTPADLGFLFRL